ncbi:hypothetical protein BG005_011675 [Podila minutissima]|nr:hypothetical protein BG005_011675 [Podila minutissima]
MSNKTVTQVHEFVVDSVIKKSREVFEEMGVSETVLGALQKGWEAKIGLVRQTSPQSSMPTTSSSSSSSESTSQTTDPGTMHAPVQEIKVEQVARSPTPTPATPSPASTAPVPVPARPPSPLYALLLALKPEVLPDINPPSVASIAASLSGVGNQVGPPDLPAPAPVPNRRRSVRNVNTPTRTSSSSKTPLRRSPRLHQTDGATVDDTDLEISNMTDLDEPCEDAPSELSFTLTLSKKAASKARRTGLGPLERATIGQVDGEDESEDQDELLGSDLDETDEDEDAMSNLILCQYDKVDKRNKLGKWKLHLSFGIVSINDRDYLFREAKGDCEWLR